jgi:hypothetical protein
MDPAANAIYKKEYDKLVTMCDEIEKAIDDMFYKRREEDSGKILRDSPLLKSVDFPQYEVDKALYDANQTKVLDNYLFNVRDIYRRYNTYLTGINRINYDFVIELLQRSQTIEIFELHRLFCPSKYKQPDTSDRSSQTTNSELRRGPALSRTCTIETFLKSICDDEQRVPSRAQRPIRALAIGRPLDASSLETKKDEHFKKLKIQLNRVSGTSQSNVLPHNEAFSLLDDGGESKITTTKLQNLVDGLDPYVIDIMISEFDSNGDGSLNQIEFYSFWNKYNNITE